MQGVHEVLLTVALSHRVPPAADLSGRSGEGIAGELKACNRQSWTADGSRLQGCRLIEPFDPAAVALHQDGGDELAPWHFLTLEGADKFRSKGSQRRFPAEKDDLRRIDHRLVELEIAERCDLGIDGLGPS
jgi:hypothetical protein